MKRNETILVYAVTGLLLVILMIAVFFGEEPVQASGANRQTQTEAVAKLPGVISALDNMESESESESEDQKLQDDAKAGAGEPKEGQEPANQPSRLMPVSLTTDGRSLSQVLEDTLGQSRRDGGFRVVSVRRGDRFSNLVRRWCGNLDHLSWVEALNEHLDSEALKSGQEMVVPWTDPEILLNAYEKRQREAAALEISSRQAEQKVRAQLYTLKKGDTLWDVAATKVPKNKIPAFIKKLYELNPDLRDAKRLRPGQPIRLPEPSPQVEK